KNTSCDPRAPPRGRGAATKPAERGPAAAPAEKGLEEIAKSSAAEFELDAATSIAAPLIKSAARRGTPLRRRLESAGLVPIRAKLIIFFSLLDIAQDFVSFVDLLKFFFGRFFVLGDIGVVFPLELPKRAPNFVVRRLLRNPQILVVISKLHCHRASNLVRPINSRNLLEHARARKIFDDDRRSHPSARCDLVERLSSEMARPFTG